MEALSSKRRMADPADHENLQDPPSILPARRPVGLDRQNRTAERLERKVDVLTEMLGVFILHQLTLVAHQPAFDSDTARLGKTRYLSFMELVERRLTRADSGEATALAKQEEQP